MCMICAAIPVTGAAGARLSAQRSRLLREDISDSRKDRANPFPILTGAAIVILIVISLIYHTYYFGKL